MLALCLLIAFSIVTTAAGAQTESRAVLSPAEAVSLFDSVCGKDGPSFKSLPAALRSNGYIATKGDHRFQIGAVKISGDDRSTNTVSYRHPKYDAQFSIISNSFGGNECALIFANKSLPDRVVSAIRKIASRKIAGMDFFYRGDSQTVVVVQRLTNVGDRRYLQLSLVYFPKSKFKK